MKKFKKIIVSFLMVTALTACATTDTETTATITENTDTDATLTQEEEKSDLVFIDEGDTSDRDRPMRILLVNDDGYDSNGIQFLHNVLTEKGYDVWTVAPLENQSGKGTSIDWNKEAHQLVEYGEQQYAFEGTPTDSFKAAISVVMPEEPDLVISGVNDGPNYGEVQMNSGTVSAAARAVRHGYPAIASSLNFFGGDNLDELLTDAVNYTAELVDTLSLEWKNGNSMMPLKTGLSINYPALDEADILGTKFVENEDIYSSFQYYKYDEEKEGIYNYVDMDKFNELMNDPDVENDLTETNKGYITISVFDGDWKASQEKVDYMKDILK